MAVDTKQKRGSLSGYGAPWRSWLSEPSGSVPVASRLSLLKYYAGASTGPNTSFGCVVEAMVYYPGARDASVYHPGVHEFETKCNG